MLGLLSTNQGGDNPYPRQDPNESSLSGGKGRNQQEVGVVGLEPKIGEEGNPLTAIATTKRRIKGGKGAGVKRVPQKASRNATPTKDNKDKKDDEDGDEEEDSDEEEEDDGKLGDLGKVIKFCWSKKKPMFEVQWSRKGVLLELAIPVLIDRPLEALEALWNGHHDNLEVLNWINRVKQMKRAVKGWMDIESYAFYNGWKGEFPVAPVNFQKKKGTNNLKDGKEEKVKGGTWYR
jgi:hypothetical protein